MKKLSTAVAFCVILTNVFAQKNFNVINFTEFLTTSGNGSMLDQGVFAIKNSKSNFAVEGTVAAGTININTIDSSITIKVSGKADAVYKISTIYNEEKGQYKSKTLIIACRNSSKTYFNFKIERTDNLKKMNIMYVTLLELNNDGYKFTCTYLKDLFQK